MCLLKTSPMQVAKEDITCYKIIEIHHLKDGKTVNQSYYQETRITFGTPIKACNEKPIEELDKYNVLDGEVVHAYYDLHSPQERIYQLKECTMSWPHPYSKAVDIALIECTIPAGTFYCIGKDHHGMSNYGALTIVPNRVIKILATVE